MELHGTFSWNSMENVDAEISMEIGVLMFSMEFHGKCPNPPYKYSMEIDVVILHGIPWRMFHGNPWNSMEVFHTGNLICLHYYFCWSGPTFFGIFICGPLQSFVVNVCTL